ncbi:MAG: hypothetical protein SGBAC_011773, partial [Bacillariaceae sp.]
MCAIAQEHRHLARVLPNTPSLWQRDYITLQPWSDYFPSILELRTSEQMSSFWAHAKALSQLSSKLVKACGIFLLFAILLTMFLPVQYEKWQLGIMFGALVEPIVILFFTYWYWNRLDVSLDAIIKYFSSGFFLCTSMVLVYEFLASMLASLAVVVYSFLGTLVLVLFGDVDIDDFEDVNLDEGSIYEVMAPPDMGGNTTTTHATNQATNTLQVPTAFVLTIALLGALLNAFGVAALVEETFKYLSFWMVEHPDMENNVSLVQLPPDENADHHHDARRSGENSELLPAGSHPPPTHSSVNPSSVQSSSSTNKHPISLESRGAAITVSMIAVAVGFACAENLLYIFVYTESNLAAETTTLILRALFPVHPLCAAIQSIAVVQRDVEKDRSIGVGRIIFVAFLLHGSFDFVLMAYSSVMGILHGDENTNTDEEAVTSVADWIVFGCSLLIPLLGLEYYFFHARKQTKRLIDLDTGRVSSSQQVGDDADVVTVRVEPTIPTARVSKYTGELSLARKMVPSKNTGDDGTGTFKVRKLVALTVIILSLALGATVSYVMATTMCETSISDTPNFDLDLDLDLDLDNSTVATSEDETTHVENGVEDGYQQLCRQLYPWLGGGSATCHVGYWASCNGDEGEPGSTGVFFDSMRNVWLDGNGNGNDWPSGSCTRKSSKSYATLIQEDTNYTGGYNYDYCVNGVGERALKYEFNDVVRPGSELYALRDAYLEDDYFALDEICKSDMELRRLAQAHL